MRTKPCTPMLMIFGVSALCLLMFVPLLARSASASDTPILIPLRFHIVTDLIMEKDGVEMRDWVTESDIIDVILPEVNHIWSSADITFTLEQVVSSPALKTRG